MIEKCRKLLILGFVLLASAAAMRAQNSAPGAKIDAAEILKKAYLYHGGEKIDRIKTVEIKGKVTRVTTESEFDVKMLIDLSIGRVRFEEWEKGELITVSQIERKAGKYAGWYFYKTGSDIIKDDEIDMVRSWSMVFVNILNLRKKNLDSMKIYSADYLSGETKFVKMVTILNENSPEAEIFNWLFDKNTFSLTGETFNFGGKTVLMLCSDFRDIDGVLFPKSCVSGENPPNTLFDLSTVKVNPKLTEKDWENPGEQK